MENKQQRIAQLQAEIAELQDLELDNSPKSKLEKRINDYLKNKLNEATTELAQLQGA